MIAVGAVSELHLATVATIAMLGSLVTLGNSAIVAAGLLRYLR